MLKVFGFIASVLAFLTGILSALNYSFQVGGFFGWYGIYSMSNLFAILTWIMLSIFLFVLSYKLK